VDNVYLDGLFKSSGILLLPVACNLIVTATDKESSSIISRFCFVTSYLKPLVTSLISKGIFDKRSDSGLAEIKNLEDLYDS